MRTARSKAGSLKSGVIFNHKYPGEQTLINNENSNSPGFASTGLSDPILKALKALNYRKPTPIQDQTISSVLAGRDILGTAQTGTGKTAAFMLPVLEILNRKGKASPNQIRALILVPTRELAAQVYESTVNYSRYLKIRSTVAYGGVKINPQMIRLSRGVDILVATPGRLLDLYRKNAVQFSRLEVLVFDEADRMLNLGFQDEVNEILHLVPRQRQTMMFTATLSDEVSGLAKELLQDPLEVSVIPEEVTLEAVKQSVFPVAHERKTELLLELMQEKGWLKFLIFVKTKNRADRLVIKLIHAGYIAQAIHGDKSQGARTRALAEFKKDKASILVATDLAARGLDIDGLPLVINFDLPHLKEDYIHRIGRTGRAGQVGEALSFVSPEEFDSLKDIERLTKQIIPRVETEGFQLDPPLPESKLDTRPFKAKKPKKDKKRKQKSL